VLVAEGDPRVLAQRRAHEIVDVPSSLGGGVRGVIDTTRCDHPHRSDETSQVVRTASYAAGINRKPGRADLAERHRHATHTGPGALFDEQVAAWRARWQAADVEVVGDPELTLAARFALFHLAGSVADRGEAAVGARGLSGPAYAGHVFWDADVFVLPVMAATHPPSARAMLEYRIRRLPAARAAARVRGRHGARFPWESAHDGSDVTPRIGIDQHGELVPIRTGELEEHITADVAWAAWHTAAWTGRWDSLEGRGRGLVVDTARYWASRVRLDPHGRAHIDGVTGPDEYHERVDDNAFTNGMAAWNMNRAVDLVERGGDRGEHSEALRWRELADALVDGYDDVSGRHRQFAGYDALEPLVASDVGGAPVAADVVLGHERAAGSQIIKQADVLMLHHLLSGAMPPGSLARDMDFYLPRTAHGSSLSPAIHASLLARLGRLDEALELLRLAQDVDLGDLTGTTAAGLHLAALAGLWHALVFGFAGVRVERPDDAALVLDPHIPEHWDELRLSLQWHGRPVVLRCRRDRVHVASMKAVTVRIQGNSPKTMLPPGGWVELTGEEIG
jgi:trehalose/maltose hydrolase-like predicted phosphorylase